MAVPQHYLSHLPKPVMAHGKAEVPSLEEGVAIKPIIMQSQQLRFPLAGVFVRLAKGTVWKRAILGSEELLLSDGMRECLRFLGRAL